MTKKVLNQIVDFLTIVTAERTYQILPIEVLLRQHPPDDVLGFLNQLRGEYKLELNRLLKETKTHPKINFLIVQIFRLRMAIKTIQKARREEVTRHEHEAEQRAAGSSGLS
jgi:hypothetical protein